MIRKLGAVLGRAFDDCLVTESIFKLLQIFGSLIQRNLIALELSDRMPILVSMLNQEMDESKVIYTKQGSDSIMKSSLCGEICYRDSPRMNRHTILSFSIITFMVVTRW